MSCCDSHKAAPAREDVLNLARAWHAGQPARTFVPGETYIPPSGKVLDADDLAMLLDSSMDMWLTHGRFSDAFAKQLAVRFGAKSAHLTVSGSAANLLAVSCLTSPKLMKKRLMPGDEILTVACGFPTTVAPIIQNGCVPVFVDVDLATGNVDVEKLAAAVGPKTKAIMLAHTLGNPFDLNAVSEIARANNLYLIEDCCDAFGATVDGKVVGSWGILSTASFYPAHHITTGEGGAVMVNQTNLARLVESFRDWGRDCWCPPGKDNTCDARFKWKLGDLPEGYDHKYTYSHLGYNMKMTDMQAAIGISQLAKADGFIEKRRANFDALKAAMIKEGLDEHFVMPEPTKGANPSWFGFLLSIRDGSPLKRRAVVEYLEDHKVGTRLLFAGNLTRQPAFKDVNYRVVGGLDVSDKVMNDSFWVGIWPGLGDAERAYMVDTFRAMVKQLAG